MIRIFALPALLALALIGPLSAQERTAPIPLPSPPWFDDVDGAGGPLSADEEAQPLAFAAAPAPATAAPSEPASPQPVTLSAKVNESGGAIPAGLVWRVYDTRVDNAGQLVMIAESEDATAALSLNPGQYVVHVAYGRAQATDTLTVEPGPNTKTMVLDAGALRLSAAVTGDVAIPINLLRFDIMGGDGPEDDREPVATNVAADNLVYLNAGVYHVVSYFGAVNAVVRADLRVEPGQLTEATLYHQASQVSFKLVSEAGGEAIADIDWAVTDIGGKTLFTALGAFPSTVLLEGQYNVTAKRGDATFTRAFTVQPGPPQEIEVLTTPANGG